MLTLTADIVVSTEATLFALNPPKPKRSQPKMTQPTRR